MKSEAIYLGYKELNLPERTNPETGERLAAIKGKAYQFTTNEWEGEIQQAKSRTYSQLVKEGDNVPAELTSLKLGEKCLVRIEDPQGFNCDYLKKEK